MIEVRETNLPGVKLIIPTFFEDFRGQYVELYNKELYKSKGIDIDFVEEDISTASKYVLKGLHGDYTTWKLISCLWGKIYLVIADPKTYKWQSFILSDVNRYQILLPPGYGNGHLCLSKESIYHYHQSEYYDPARQFTIVWNDKNFSIFWPIKNPILSKRDITGDKKYIET